MPMPKLTENAWIDGVGYGPGFDDRQPPSPDGLVDHDLPPVPPLPDTPVADLPPGDDALSWLDEPTEGAEPATAGQLLAQVPDDLEALAAFAEAHGLPVDGRLGAVKLRASLEQALAAP